MSRRQAPKRIREKQTRREHKQPFATVRVTMGLHQNDERLRIYKPLSNDSRFDLQDTALELRRKGAQIVLGGFVLDVVEPIDMFFAIEDSSLFGLIDLGSLMRELKQEVAPNLNAIDSVAITEIGQYGEWIGVGVISPAFIEARDVLASAVNRFTGSDYVWPDMSPHVRIGRGNIDRVEAPEQVTVPYHVDFCRTKFGNYQN